MDNQRVQVTEQSSAAPASVTFFFDETGDVTGLGAADRPMTVGATTIATPWRGSSVNTSGPVATSYPATVR
jgi:hypothetical protein